MIQSDYSSIKGKFEDGSTPFTVHFDGTKEELQEMIKMMKDYSFIDDANIIHQIMNAAHLGDAEAQMAFGDMHMEGVEAEGISVKRDFHEAIRWYKMAADQNLAEAQHRLSELNFNTKGEIQTPEEVAGWLKLSAGNGFALAQYHLAEAYLDSDGVEYNYNLALEWYGKAAAQGHPASIEKLRELQHSQTKSSVFWDSMPLMSTRTKRSI